MKNKLISILFTLLVATGVAAQEEQMRYLSDQCPRLTDLYANELENCHAHYIFAVDVSGSMCKYEDLVRPALEAFVHAAPIGDRVTIIPFGREAVTNNMQFDVDLTVSAKKSMLQLMGTLYPNAKERKSKPYQYTNIYAAQQAVAESVREYATYDVNIIVFISDLLHCPDDDGNPNNDRQFKDSEMDDMRNLIRAAKHENAEYLVFTLELPKAGSDEGYIFPQLQELYNVWGVNVKQQRIPANSEELIRQWFERQKNNIMFMKLQSIIMRENKANPIVVKTEIDIDGNVKAHIEWKATKLYPQIVLDSTYILNSDFRFKANPEFVHHSERGAMCADLKLGQIKHKSIGFHKMADTLHFDVKLPVDYQSEIDKLLVNGSKPLANTSVYSERLIFTFFLPLWFTITLIVLFILYIIGVIKAIGRNNKLCFKGNITVYDPEGNQIDEVRRMGKQPSNAVILLGANGSPMARVEGAEWQFEIRKQNGNPFLLFAQPKFVWKKTKGFCAAGKAQSGVLTSTIALRCGSSATEVTHKIRVQLVK